MRTALVIRKARVDAHRWVVVSCPFCGGEHEHLHPGNLGALVGLRPAPCRPGVPYRPEWDQ